MNKIGLLFTLVSTAHDKRGRNISTLETNESEQVTEKVFLI